MAPINVAAETPIRGLACLRSPSGTAGGNGPIGPVYALFPVVPGPRHSIRALRADFKPFWLELAEATTRSLDPRCLVGTNKDGYLVRMDAGRRDWKADVAINPNEIVAVNVSR